MWIAEVLVKNGLLTQEQVQSVSALMNGERFDRAAIELGFIGEEQVLRAIAQELGMRYVDLNECSVDPELLAELPTTYIFRHWLLPLERADGHVVVATSDPFDLEAIDEVGAITGLRLRPVLARRDDLIRAVKTNLGVSGDTVNELVAKQSPLAVDVAEDPATGKELAEMAQMASVIRLVNELLMEALEQNATDVHIEAEEQGLVVRFRIDGMLQIQPVPPEIRQLYAAIVTRLKIMANLNIAERRLPQDGRFQFTELGREVDVRVSIVPALHGEGIVLRLLDKQRMVFELASVGMDDDVARTFRELIALPHGIVLVTGPTGCGKSTTLYSALSEIKSAKTKIITVEDPVEYQTPGIVQIQVHSKIGLTFAAGLRHILRHDPDMILIGEIRDRETAVSAIQAALTGHMVFSTLHTNDAASAFTRLTDMGVEPYLVASTVEGVLAQRLVRILCNYCKVQVAVDVDRMPPDFPRPLPDRLWQPAGCHQCRGTGYRGRTGIFELLRSRAEIRRLCLGRESSEALRDCALRHGMVAMRQCGWQKVRQGVTSVDEILRVSKAEVE
jgi:general secretion pathway protein E/type IV pilus assembly protein PilB